jgi:hypothetical protein
MWLTLLLSLCAAPSFASEIDDISTFYQTLAPADEALDGRVQKALDAALSASTGCDFEAFGRAVTADLVSMRFYSGAMERFAWNDPGIARIKMRMKNSIYAGTPFAYSVVGLAYGLDPVISVGGVKLGTDKIGHFIDHGHALYKRSLDGTALPELVAYSTEEEEGAFGYSTTGIKSHADIAADIDGFIFWRDVYGRGARPFVRCEGGKLRAARGAFRFADYVTAAWSEAINCNQYNGDEIAMPSLDEVQLYLEQLDLPANACDDAYADMKAASAGAFTRAVLANVKALEKKEQKRFRCPIDPALCGRMRKEYESRYGAAIRDQILSPECRGK